MSAEPTAEDVAARRAGPDIDGMGPPLARPPDEHTALMLLRRICDDWTGVARLGAVWHLRLDGGDLFLEVEALSLSPAELDLLRRLTEENDR